MCGIVGAVELVHEPMAKDMMAGRTAHREGPAPKIALRACVAP